MMRGEKVRLFALRMGKEGQQKPFFADKSKLKRQITQYKQSIAIFCQVEIGKKSALICVACG
jgi:hypothetical protein